jgi:hypothetical protein
VVAATCWCTYHHRFGVASPLAGMPVSHETGQMDQSEALQSAAAGALVAGDNLTVREECGPP